MERLVALADSSPPHLQNQWHRAAHREIALAAARMALEDAALICGGNRIVNADPDDKFADGHNDGTQDVEADIRALAASLSTTKP